MTAPVRVALVGTHGYGRIHRANLERLATDGVARLVGVVDVAEPPEELRAIHHASLPELLAALGPDEAPEIVIIATPIDTHVPLALIALEAGCDVYLEKPPVPSLTDHAVLLDAARAAGRSVQVGFQARGGAGVDELRETVVHETLGEVTAVHVYGAWTRDRAYYRRSRWAGRRRLDGHRVADGVATNPLAHAVHAGLAAAGMTRVEDVAQVTTELRRAHDIEADDTSFLRIEPAGDGPSVIAALTTTSPEQGAPWVEVVATGGTLRLFYTEDRSEARQADGTVTTSRYERADLLENLLAHVRDRGTELISPLASTGAFSAVLEAIQSVPDPLPIDAEHVDWIGEGEKAHPAVHDIREILARALEAGRPFSEIGVGWAREDAVSVWTP
ncbi:Gfo/Idh/MocA family protein [Brachybacterium sp. DNPG3]